jgi:NADPH:quinone reductase-like Zn-dependent oxidoreductase
MQAELTMNVSSNAYNFEDGAFAEYANVKPDVSMKVPANLTSEEAVSIGVAITTVVCYLCTLPQEKS